MAEREPGQPESVDGSGTFERAAGATSFLQRAVIRRRVRFLRRRRELALHDLGGFVFESHRLSQPSEDLLAEKLESLTALDGELALLQRSLELHEELAVLREPGIAACAYCAAIRDSAANFCPNCGRPAGTPAQEPEVASASGESPSATSEDSARYPPAPSAETVVQAHAAVGDGNAVQAPTVLSEHTAVQAPAELDPPLTVDAVAAAQATPAGGEAAPSVDDGRS
jgi:hypothetical protein